MLWTAFTVAIAYQFLMLVPVYILIFTSPRLSHMMLMGLSSLLGGLMLYGYLKAQGVAEEVTAPGEMNVAILGAVAAALAATFLLSATVSGLLASLFGTKGLSVSTEFEALMTTSRLAETVFAVVLVGPIVEEFVYRGLLMGVLLARGWPPLLAAGVAAAIFALQHIQYGWIGMVTVMIVGMALGLLRVAGGGLLAPILAHMIQNALSLMFS